MAVSDRVTSGEGLSGPDVRAPRPHGGIGGRERKSNHLVRFTVHLAALWHDYFGSGRRSRRCSTNADIAPLPGHGSCTGSEVIPGPVLPASAAPSRACQSGSSAWP